jgi:hypothetical protein
MESLYRSRSGDLVAALLMAAGIVAAAIAPLILFIEAFEWMTRSEWPGLTLADGLSLFGIAHSGAETESRRLADLLLAAPLTVALFGTGVCTFLLGASLGRWDRERALWEELRREPLSAVLALSGGSDVSYPAAVRLLFLDLLLEKLLWLGVAFLAVELVLVALSVDLRWLGVCGLLIGSAALAARLIARRKLSPHGSERPGGRL